MQRGSFGSHPTSLMLFHIREGTKDMCVTLQMSVLNAELSAERRDENVGNNSPHRISSCARGRTPHLATQQWVGILSKRWPGTGPSDRGRVPFSRPHLTGMTASKGVHGPANVNTKLL
jgi:hypothetical protein